MSQFELQVELRTKVGKGESHRLRREGKIPAIYYGKDQESVLLALNPNHLEKAVASKAGMNVLLSLKVAGKGDYNALIKDYQGDAITRAFKHVDFLHVDLNKKIKVNVPVHVTGSAIGVKEGGILQQTTRELEIWCSPTNIPQEITLDVTELKLGHNSHLHDLKLPEGVEVAVHLDVPIVSILIPREEEVAAPAAGELKEPEVLTAKKEEGADAAAKPADGKDAKKEVKKEEKKK